MTLSRTSLVERAWLRNQSGPAAGVPLARYDAMEPQARTELARNVAMNPGMADLLKKDISLSVAGGFVSLSTFLEDSEPILLEFVKLARITSSDAVEQWQYVGDYGIFTLTRPSLGMVYFTISGNDLYASTDVPLTTTANARTSYVPLASTLSGNLDLEEQAIKTLAQMMAGVPDAAAA